MKKVYVVHYRLVDSSWDGTENSFPISVNFETEPSAREFISDASYIFEGQIVVDRHVDRITIYESFKEWKEAFADHSQQSAKVKLNSFIHDLTPYEKKIIRDMLPDSSLMKDQEDA
jgi:hypothetical protein